MSAVERREYLVGILTALLLVAVLVLTVLANRRAQGDSASEAFVLTAEFNRADGIYVGSPVRLAGMSVGKVVKVALVGGRAVTTLRFTNPVPIPEDTAAVIETDGLFGSKYIELRPGGEEKTLASGGRISYTQDSVILEDLIAMIVSRAKAKTAAGGGTK